MQTGIIQGTARPRRQTRHIALLAAVFLSAGVLAQAWPFRAAYAESGWEALPWAVRGGDPAHSGRIAAYGPDEAGVAWQLQTYRMARSNPVVDAGGRVYVADNSGAACISKDGVQLWRKPLGWCQDGGLALGPGPSGDLQLYLGSHDPWIFWCLGAEDGRVRWQVSLPAPADGPPAIDAESNVWFGCDDGLVRCYTPAGVRRWTAAMGGPVRSSPAFGPGGEAYAVSFGGRLVALDSAGGTIWQRELGCTSSSSPVLGQGRVYVGDARGRAWCFDLSGEVIFCTQLSGPLGQPTVDGAGGSYFGSGVGSLYALTPSGQVSWTFRANGPIRPHVAPVVDLSGRVYFGASDGFLRAIDADGALRWQLAIGGELGALAVASDGSIVLGSNQGWVKQTVPGSPEGPDEGPEPCWPPLLALPEPGGLDGWHIVRPEIAVEVFPGTAWPQGTYLCWSTDGLGAESGRAGGGPVTIAPDADGEFELRLWLEREGEVTRGPLVTRLGVDTGPPVINVSFPINGGTVEAGAPLAPQVEATDAVSGVAVLTVLLDDREPDPAVPLAPGPHVLTVTCRDRAGLCAQTSVEFTAVDGSCSALPLNPVLVGRRGSDCGAAWARWVTVLVRVPEDVSAEGLPESIFLGDVPGAVVAKFPVRSAHGQRLFLMRFERRALDAAVGGACHDPVGSSARVFRASLDLRWYCGSIPCVAAVGFVYIP